MKSPLVLSFVGCSICAIVKAQIAGKSYGVDCSFPIHKKLLTGCGNLLGDRESFYETFMTGCREKYNGKKCDLDEDARIALNLKQPESIMNLTANGFKALRTPHAVKDLLTDYWQKNKYRMREERWPEGATAVNHWASPTYLVDIEDKRLRGGGKSMKAKVRDATKSVVEKWTGIGMKPTAMHGIRVHTEGAVIPPHVDRASLWSSAIVNVAQDLDEAWVFELYNRAGNAENVTLEPGDMLVYESGTLLHGNPFPLKGRYFAAFYMHFEPMTAPLHSYHEEMGSNTRGVSSLSADDSVELKHSDPTPGSIQSMSEIRNKTKAATPHSTPLKRPEPTPELNKSSEPTLNREGTLKKHSSPKPRPAETSLPAHTAAAVGDLDKLAKIVSKDKRAAKLRDKNGWQPIHEACRTGQIASIELLVAHGADVNTISNFGKGRSPLRIASDYLGEGHPALSYLKSLGAVDFGPEL